MQEQRYRDRHHHHHKGPDAIGLVQQAIQQADLVRNGVNFAPFILKMIPNSPPTPNPLPLPVPPYWNFWNSQKGDTQISFFRYCFYQNWLFGNFRPFGDFVTIKNAPFPTSVLMAAPDANNPDALAPPADFVCLLTDHGSGNGAAFSYWRIIPPDGYCALGVAFMDDWTTKPSPSNYWCVKEDYVEPCSNALYWSDSNTHIHANSSLYIPTIDATSPRPDGSLLIAPPTFLSAQDLGNEPSFALRVSQALLPITPLAPGEPTSGPGVGAGSETALGIDYVAIVPYMAVEAEKNLPNQGLLYPFYCVASLPYWICQSVEATAGGGMISYTYSIGTSETESQSMSTSTTLTLDCSVGAQYKSVTGTVSGSFSETFGLSVDSSQTQSSDYSYTLSLNFPQQPETWVWGNVKRIAVFRSDGTLIDTGDFAQQELEFEPGSP